MKLARLVWGKADVLAAELASLTKAQACDDFFDDAPHRSSRSGKQQAVVTNITLRHVVAFDTWVVQMVREYPYQLPVFARSAHTEVCQSRMVLCQTLMLANNDLLHINAL